MLGRIWNSFSAVTHQQMPPGGSAASAASPTSAASSQRALLYSAEDRTLSRTPRSWSVAPQATPRSARSQGLVEVVLGDRLLGGANVKRDGALGLVALLGVAGQDDAVDLAAGPPASAPPPDEPLRASTVGRQPAGRLAHQLMANGVLHLAGEAAGAPAGQDLLVHQLGRARHRRRWPRRPTV